MPLSDSEVKALISRWPQYTRTWSRPGETIGWLRAQPIGGVAVGPRLETPGEGAFKTQPDGLWISFGITDSDDTTRATFVDCVVIESCRTHQNFSDKRSRYAARTTSLVLGLPGRWLDESVQRQNGGSRQRRELLRGRLPPDTAVSLPVRHLRVLYALPNDGVGRTLFARVRSAMVLEAHEYLCPQQVLGSFTAQEMQAFLRRMAPGLQIYP